MGGGGGGSDRKRIWLSWWLSHWTDQTVELEPFALSDLLPGNSTSYYRYYGSLTTPPCYETVIWTIFTERIEISQEQVCPQLLSPHSPTWFYSCLFHALQQASLTWTKYSGDARINELTVSKYIKIWGNDTRNFRTSPVSVIWFQLSRNVGSFPPKKERKENRKAVIGSHEAASLAVQFSLRCYESRWRKSVCLPPHVMVCMRSGKSLRLPPRLSEVSPPHLPVLPFTDSSNVGLVPQSSSSCC